MIRASDEVVDQGDGLKSRVKQGYARRFAPLLDTRLCSILRCLSMNSTCALHVILVLNGSDEVEELMGEFDLIRGYYGLAVTDFRNPEWPRMMLALQRFADRDQFGSSIVFSLIH